ncbi:MAG: PorV/PorQ family protein [Elusimicrobia bacterium]|nr:PorV/PorQ family protein [Elusimicrobiota bacterium]
MRGLLLAAGLAALACAQAAAEAGRTAAQMLQRPLSARAVGLGEAFTAVGGGVDSLGYNPAGTARLARPELGSLYNRGFADDSFGWLGYAHPLGRAVLSGGFMYYDAGTVALRFSDGREENRAAERDLAALLAAAVPLDFGLCAGASVKVFRSRLAEEAQASGYAADVGALWKSPLKGLDLGAALQNLGPDVKFEEEADPLPLTLRFGAAYTFDLSGLAWFKDGGFGFSRFLVSADAVKIRRTPDLLPAAGMEMGMDLGDGGSGSLRAGYMFSRSAAAFTVGAGLRQGRWSLDYGLGAMKQLTNEHHVSLGVRF